MSVTEFLLDAEPGAARVVRAVVLTAARHSVDVLVDGETWRCDRLDTGMGDVELERGDHVLVWHAGRATERAVVLGRIAAQPRRRRSSPAAREAPPDAPPAAATPTPSATSAAAVTPVMLAASPGGAPDELVLEAKQSLTLRVGAGSITIREDGKILIKGTDLVSHARRTNRIRGGAVSIN
jgi:hypothetical protein